ncbi:MAG TPA: hypothetical protein VJ647_03130 [Chitinophagaceae bacterium]|nr:hypothetical protein [Chitinophagaceae bacterium]
MNTNDKIIAKGSFHLRVYENGALTDTINEHNLVVTLGHQNMARLIGGHASGKKIEKISVGTSAIDPVIGNTTITGAFTKAIDGATYPDDQSVLFSFDIDNSEANGMTIREFGLLNTDNVLCARKVRAGEIIKTNAIRLVGTWKLTFS